MINVRNEVWNKLSLSKIITSFAPFGVMNDKLNIWSENMNWEWNGFWWGFVKKNNNGCVIMHLYVISNYFRDISLKISDMQRWQNISKSCPNFRRCNSRNSTELINYEYVFEISRRCISEIKNQLIGRHS